MQVKTTLGQAAIKVLQCWGPVKCTSRCNQKY